MGWIERATFCPQRASGLLKSVVHCSPTFATGTELALRLKTATDYEIERVPNLFNHPQAQTEGLVDSTQLSWVKCRA